MTTLCIETATEHGMVVVARDEGSIAAMSWRSTAGHAEDLLGRIDSALAKAGAARDEISLVGVGVGPGRFTSVRVGLATAKGLALGLGIPIVGVSSLRVLARSISAPPGIVRVPVMHAYRGDVFAAAFAVHGDRVDELVAPCFGAPHDVFQRIRETVEEQTIAVRGDGVDRHAELVARFLQSPLDESARRSDAEPDALLAEVLQVRRVQGPSDLASLEPQYLRPSDAKLPERPLRTNRDG
jgi:tRNA threonylcarbamoyl adenosine modification protein YeaZ